MSYLTVAVLSLGLLGGLYHEFPGLVRTAGLVPAGLVVAMFAVTSLLHWHDVTADRGPDWR